MRKVDLYTVSKNNVYGHRKGGTIGTTDFIMVMASDYEVALAREAALREELDAVKRVGPPHFCGLPMSLNPHAEAGKPGRFLEVGTHRECIPCLVSSRHGWAKTAGELQQRLTVAEQRASMLEREFKKLRDVAHGCYEIASSYSGCIDGVEEHGGDDHEDPSCAIFHRLYYAMFDAGRALKPAADPAKPSANCPNCKVCMGLPEFPENCLINGIKP